MNIYIDFETRSRTKLDEAGSFKYFEDPSTDALCLSYAVGMEKAQTWVPSMLQHKDLWDLITQKDIRLYAWNTTFDMMAWEYIMHRRYGWPRLPDGLWYDVQAVAASLGYPVKLEDAAPAFHLTENKLASGTRLINFFSKPKADGSFNDPNEHPSDFQDLILYCQRDVHITQDIHDKVGDLSPRERAIWLHTLQINKRGVYIDAPACRNAIKLISQKREQLNGAITVHTGGEIPRITMRERIRKWVNTHCGMNLENMQGTTLEPIIKQIDEELADPIAPQAHKQLREARILLKWYLAGNKSSVAKYESIINRLSCDGTIKGFLFYHGAGTGRYAGRGVQFQNFPNKTLDDAESVIDCLMEDNLDLVELFVGDIFEVSKQLLRSVIMAPPGKKLCVADYKSIEAVATAWACGEWDILQGFVRGLDQYRQMAAKMYHVDYGMVTKDQRQAGKIAVLACGFGGSGNAILGMAKKMGIDVDETTAFNWAGQFRSARPQLVEGWKQVEHAMKRALVNAKDGEPIDVKGVKGMQIMRAGSDLRTILPSGRMLNYPLAVNYSQVVTSEIFDFESEEIEPKKIKRVVEMNAMWVDNQYRWVPRSLYGSLLFQNYIQGLCRDILVDAQLRLEEQGFPICINVHDELGGLVDNDDNFTFNRFRSVMTLRPQWLAEDFPVLADGYIAKRYRK